MIPLFLTGAAASGLSPRLTLLRWPLPSALIISVLIRTCLLDVLCPVRRQGPSLPGLAVQQQRADDEDGDDNAEHHGPGHGLLRSGSSC